jgi:hypothetical protein
MKMDTKKTLMMNQTIIILSVRKNLGYSGMEDILGSLLEIKRTSKVDILVGCTLNMTNASAMAATAAVGTVERCIQVTINSTPRRHNGRGLPIIMINA